MTDMVNVESHTNVSDEFFGTERPAYKVDETYWGYIVRSSEGPGIGIIAAQAASMIMGASLLTAATAIWLLPTMVIGTDDAIMRAGVTVIFSAAAILFLWYASRGTETELQIDTTLGEIREVVRNRTGKSTLLGRYGFDSIGGVFLDRSGRGDLTTLVMRYRNTAQTLLIAQGHEETLVPLRNRMGRDVLVNDDFGA